MARSSWALSARGLSYHAFMVDLGGGTSSHDAGVAAALELAGSFTRHEWGRYIFVGRAIRNQQVEACDGPRLPIYVVDRDGAVNQIRCGGSTLFNGNGIYGLSMGKGSLLNMAVAPCLIKDKTASPLESLYWERQLAYQRSLPRSVVGVKSGVLSTYGDTILIVPPEFASEAAPWGYVIEAQGGNNGPADLSRLEHQLRNWRAHAGWLLSKTIHDIRFDPGALPESRSASNYLRFGHLHDLAFFASLERACGISGFTDAVRESWEYLCRHVTRRLTTRQQDAIVVSYLREFLRTGQADHEKGFREDSLARIIRHQDPEMFGQYSALDLGKALLRMGLGTVSRHGFYDEARRVIRSVVNFDGEDMQRMEQIESGL